MANIPVNATSTYIAPGQTVTGRFGGFYVEPNTILDRLVDANGGVLVAPASPLTMVQSGYIPLFVTIISINAGSTGGVILFP